MLSVIPSKNLSNINSILPTSEFLLQYIVRLSSIFSSISSIISYSTKRFQFQVIEIPSISRYFFPSRNNLLNISSVRHYCPIFVSPKITVRIKWLISVASSASIIPMLIFSRFSNTGKRVDGWNEWIRSNDKGKLYFPATYTRPHELSARLSDYTRDPSNSQSPADPFRAVTKMDLEKVACLRRCSARTLPS